MWDNVIPDCRTALEIDPSVTKAHFFLGHSLLETECYDESVTHLQRGKNDPEPFVHYQLIIIIHQSWW